MRALRPLEGTQGGFAGRSGGVGVAAAGVIMIGVAYGFARYGYGLFEPAIRAEFHLSVAASGAVSSVGYVGYIAGLLTVGCLVDRVGPRAMIAAAGATAVLGLGTMAISQNPALLVLGVVVAGASSGLGWAPYSDVVHRSVDFDRRGTVLAAVASGTSFGIAVAGVLALASGLGGWRPVWAIFCGVGVLAMVVNAAAVPKTATSTQRPASLIRLVKDARSRSAPRRLFATALSYGVIGAVYWTFAVAAITSPSSSPMTGPIFWTAIGVSGTVAVAAGLLFRRIGLRRSHSVMFGSLGAASLVIALAPSSAWAVGASALGYGFAFMATSGLLAVWSYELFPDHPSVGFTATVLMLGIGSVLGPVALGVVADIAGFASALLVIGIVSLVTLAARPLGTTPDNNEAAVS